MSVQSLLPSNGKPFLRALEQAIAYEPRLTPGIDLIPNVKGREFPDWLRFLLYEYGLIELTSYVPNPYDLLDTGRDWQIERDTWAAIARGLGWIASPGTIVEAPVRRVWWNSFQLYLDSLPAADSPHLERIDRVTTLSKPFRSDFRRGVYGYDAPAAETDTTLLDACLLDRESGVRVRPGGPLWSFGRPWELDHVLTKAEGQALGIWINPAAAGAFIVDFVSGEATIGDDTEATIAEATNFSRGAGKFAQALDGSWIEFGPDELAITDRGVSLEPAATRLSTFWLDANPVDDVAAAEVLATGIADPLGGTRATRFRFSGSKWLLYVPTEGLEPSTTYGVSFFAKLVATSGSGISGGSGTLVSFFPQLVTGQWVRVVGEVTTPAELDGQWLDLSLFAPGGQVDVDLGGFQVEEGAVTSPIVGDEINGTRDADELVLDLPGVETYNLTITFDDGTAQPLLGSIGPTLVDPEELSRPYVRQIGTLRAGTWASMAFPWDDADFPWNGDDVAARARMLASYFDGSAAHFRLKAAGGAVIGYRRTRVVRQVGPAFEGPLVYAGSTYAASEEGTTVLVEAMTDAGNGAGQTVASVDLIVGGTVAPGIPEGRLWLGPGQLTGGTVVAAGALSIPLRATVRERLKLMLRF